MLYWVKVPASLGNFKSGWLVHRVEVATANIERNVWRLHALILLITMVGYLSIWLGLKSLVSRHLVLHLHPRHLNSLVLANRREHAGLSV